MMSLSVAPDNHMIIKRGINSYVSYTSYKYLKIENLLYKKPVLSLYDQSSEPNTSEIFEGEADSPSLRNEAVGDHAVCG